MLYNCRWKQNIEFIFLWIIACANQEETFCISNLYIFPDASTRKIFGFKTAEFLFIGMQQHRILFERGYRLKNFIVISHCFCLWWIYILWISQQGAKTKTPKDLKDVCGIFCCDSVHHRTTQKISTFLISPKTPLLLGNAHFKICKDLRSF